MTYRSIFSFNFFSQNISEPSRLVAGTFSEYIPVDTQFIYNANALYRKISKRPPPPPSSTNTFQYSAPLTNKFAMNIVFSAVLTAI